MFSRKVPVTAIEKLKGEIEAKCRGGYAYWRIGLANDLSRAREDWSTLNYGLINFTAWRASSLSEALRIEGHFVSQGMKGVQGQDLSAAQPVYVVVF